jgi:hypothetical protein
MDEDKKQSSGRSTTHKRNIQPQQQKNKGVTRIINGPKKNAIIKRVNPKQKTQTPSKQSLQKTDDKSLTVYDRLYNSRSSKERKKPLTSTNSSMKKMAKNSTIRTHKKYTPTKPKSASNHNITEYTGYISHGHSTKPTPNNRMFSLSNDSRDPIIEKVKKRQPTPVAHKEKPMSASQSIPSFGTGGIIVKHNTLFDSDDKLPKFASENPSCRSKLSDQVEDHPLTEFDDFEVEDNISSIVLNIKKQNENLRGRIHSKNRERIELAGTMNPNIKNKINGVPLDEFQTPEASKHKTIMLEGMSGGKHMQTLTNTVTKVANDLSYRNVDTDEGDFDRDETVEIAPRLNMSGFAKKSEMSERIDSPKNVKLLTYEDSVMLKSCMKRLSEKLKLVKSENQRLQYEKYQDSLKFQKLLDEANKKVDEYRSQNNKLNKKLIQAIVTIKMS